MVRLAQPIGVSHEPSQLLFSLSTAHAVPVQLTQQGRLLDSSGAAINGLHLMTFRLLIASLAASYSGSPAGRLYRGLLMAALGTNTAVYPLDDSVLLTTHSFKVEVDGGGPISARQPVASTPMHAFRAQRRT